jgi:hypothetical protein
MPIIEAASTDGYVVKTVTGTSTWADVRDATTGSGVNATQTRSALAVAVLYGQARGGLYGIYRAFFAFDTSGITAPVASATINIYGYSAGDLDIIGVKATKPDLSTGIAAADYDAITGFSAGSSMNGNVTDYTAEVTSWNTSAYNSITLNAAALSDLQSLSVFAICFVDHTYDYLNVAPNQAASAVYITDNNGMYFKEGGTGLVPAIDYTLATGYTHNVLGVAAANVAKVNGVATANIDKINGVD